MYCCPTESAHLTRILFLCCSLYLRYLFSICMPLNAAPSPGRIRLVRTPRKISLHQFNLHIYLPLRFQLSCTSSLLPSLAAFSIVLPSFLHLQTFSFILMSCLFCHRSHHLPLILLDRTPGSQGVSSLLMKAGFFFTIFMV